MISQKSRYALRSLFELAKRHSRGSVKISEISRAQAIPARFLESILVEMKKAGLVDSHRGKSGGYFLLKAPENITVGTILRLTEGTLVPVDCLTASAGGNCKLQERCVFVPMWEEAHQAVAGIYDRTTLQSLVDKEQKMKEKYTPSYSI